MKTSKSRIPKTRTHISSAGSFVAVPDAFPNSDDNIRNAIKLEFQTIFSDKHRVETVFSTDKVLIDIAAIDPSALDPELIARDCDLYKDIALKYPNELRQILIAMQSGGRKGIATAEKLAKKIKLTEKDAIKSGGGFFWLIIPAIAMGLGACSGANNNKPFKQSTLPRPRTDEAR